MLLPDITKKFFPKEYSIVYIEETDQKYEFGLLSESVSARCPKCGKENRRMHSYHEKDVQELVFCQD